MWEHLPVEIHHFVRRKTFPGWEIAPRQLDDYEIVYILQGKGKITIRDQHFLVDPGDLICFYPGVRHSLALVGEPYMEFYGVHFGIPEEMDELPFPEHCHVDSRRLESLFRQLESAWRSPSQLSAWQKNLLVEQILCEGMSALELQKSYHSHRIRRVLERIHSDPMGNHALDELIALSGVKKTAFLQAFREVTGQTPLQYVQNLRLEYACDLLRQTELPIAEVAQRSGFEDSFYFSRVFRKRFGQPPSRWRSEK